jgi:hypothetical protein
VGYCYPSGLEKTLYKWDIYVSLVTKGLIIVIPLLVPEFKCGNGKDDAASLHATEANGKVRLELVKSYPRNKMRVGDHIHANGHISPEGRSPVFVDWKASWTP